LKETRNILKNAGKGHNEILEVISSVVHTQSVTVAVQRHVPENGGT
jgi:hypothetical protein